MDSKAASDKESLTERLGQLDHILKKRLDDFIKTYDGKFSKFNQLPSASDFETKYIISKGQFGEVHIVQKKISKDVYATRILHKAKLLAHHEDVSFLLEELDVLTKATSPWISKLHFAFQDAKNLYLVMECYCGDFRSMLTRYEGDLEEDIARFYVGEITLAIHNLHLMGYVHRDVKPENVLMDCRGHVMLAGFGFAVKLDHTQKTTSRMAIRPPEYISPYLSPKLLETNQRQNVTYGAEVDWWSLGICLYEMMHGKLPFTDNVAYSILNHKKYLKFPENDSKNPIADDLIRKLLTIQDDGLKYSEIEKHSFLASFNSDKARKETAPCAPRLSSVGSKSDQDGSDMNHSRQTCDNVSGRYLSFFDRRLSSTRSQGSVDCKPIDATKHWCQQREKGENKNMPLLKCMDHTFCKEKVTQQQPQIEKTYNYHESYNEEYKKLAVKHSKLQQHNNHQNEEFSVLRSEHTLLKQLEEAEKKCKFQNEMMDKVRTEKTDYECQIKTLEKIVEDLNFRLEESQVNQTKQQQAYMELKAEFQKYKNEANVKFMEETQAKAILTQQVEELNSIIHRNDENIRHLKKEMIQAKDALAKSQSSFDQTKSKLEENEMTLKHVQCELEATKVNLETEILQQENRKKSLQDKINCLTGDVEHQNKLLKEEEEKYNRLCLKHMESEESCVKVATEKEKLEMCLRQKNEEQYYLQKRLDHSNNDLISLQTVKENFDQSLSQTFFKLEIQSTDLMDMSERLEEAEKKGQCLIEILDKVRTEKTKYECHIQTLEKNVEDLNFRLEESLLNQTKQKQVYSELKAEFQKYKNEANVKSMEETQAKDILTQQVEELKSIIHRKDENIRHLNKEMTQEKDALLKTQSSFDQIKSKLEENEMTLKHVYCELEATKVNLETEIFQHEKRNKSLQDKINCLIGDVEHQNKLLKEEEEKHNRLCLKHKESEKSCVKLATEKEKLEMCLSQQNEENHVLQKRLDHLNNDLISLQTVKENLDQSLSQTLFKLEIQSTDLMDLSERLEEAEKKSRFLNEMLDKVKTEITEYEGEIKTLERNVEDLNFRLEESQVNQTKQQQAYMELKAEFQKYKNEANVKSMEETQAKDILTQQVEELKSIIHIKNENVRHLNKEMTQAKDALAKTQSSFDQTKSKLEENEMTLKHVHCELEATKVNLETEIFQQEKRNKSLQDKINCLIGDVEHQNKLLKEEEEKYNRFCLKHMVSEESCVKLATEKEKLEMCLRQKKEENHVLKKRLDHLNSDLISLQTVKENLDQSLSQTLFKLEIQSTDLMDMSERLEEAERKCHCLIETLDKVRTEKTEYEGEIKTLERNVEDLNFRLEESKVNQIKQQQVYRELKAEFQKYKNEANVKSMEEMS